MFKILLLPLFDSLPSGHHQVASAVAQYIRHRDPDIDCRIVDLMSRWSPALERVMVQAYLGWIRHAPSSYARVYKQLAYRSVKHSSYKHYDYLFLQRMHEILEEERPDLILCTHAFPSYLVDKLKKTGTCCAPVINLYTDYFINDVWGKASIDYHFVPDSGMKAELIQTYGVAAGSIRITGIPIDECFVQSAQPAEPDGRFHVMLAGGSAGLGRVVEQLRGALWTTRGIATMSCAEATAGCTGRWRTCVKTTYVHCRTYPRGKR